MPVSMVMPIKNNAIIYNGYRDAILRNGIPDTLVCDRGREFYLMLSIHEHLSDFRTNANRVPYRQLPSTKVIHFDFQ